MNDLVGVCFALFTLWVIARIIGGEQMQQMVRERSYGLCQVGVVKSMFPHVPEASIRYDLMVSGSAEVTCDKILQQGYLPPPPDGFPGTEEARAAPREESSQPIPAADAPAPAPPANLISRYHLEERLADSNPESHASPIKSVWHDNADDRQKSLQERKAQMILQARRRMAQRQNQQDAAPNASVSPL